MATSLATPLGTSLATGLSAGLSFSPLPTIDGIPYTGETLTVTPGVFPGADTYTYQWMRDGAVISGATSTTYVVQSADSASSITCLQVALDASANAIGSASSNALVTPDFAGLVAFWLGDSVTGTSGEAATAWPSLVDAADAPAQATTANQPSRVIDPDYGGRGAVVFDPDDLLDLSGGLSTGLANALAGDWTVFFPRIREPNSTTRTLLAADDGAGTNSITIDLRNSGGVGQVIRVTMVDSGSGSQFRQGSTVIPLAEIQAGDVSIAVTFDDTTKAIKTHIGTALDLDSSLSRSPTGFTDLTLCPAGNVTLSGCLVYSSVLDSTAIAALNDWADSYYDGSQLTASESVYVLGNSWCLDANTLYWDEFAAQSGEARTFGRHIRTGNPVEYMVDNPADFTAAFTTERWDTALSPGAFDVLGIEIYGGNTQTVSDVADAVETLCNTVGTGTRIVLYSTWPANEGNYSTSWLKTIAAATYTTRAFQDDLHAEIISRLPSHDITMVSVGELIYLIDQEIVGSGNWFGHTNVFDLYRDTSHLSDLGAWVAGLAYWSTLSGDNPTDFKIPIAWHELGESYDALFDDYTKLNNIASWVETNLASVTT